MANEREFASITCSELIRKITARQGRLSHKDVKMAVRESLDYLSETLSRGQRIEVRGFGSFSLRFRDPRVTRNPKTRQMVAVSGRSIPYFKPSSLLSAGLNKSDAEDDAGDDARAGAEAPRAPWDKAP